MTRIDPELERTVRSWLQDGVNTLPDRVFDAVLDSYPTTRQRRVGWWIGDPAMTRMLLAATAVLVLAVTLVGLLLGTNIGDEDPDATWHRLPTVEAAPLAAGGLLIDDPFPVRIGLTLPDGWSGDPIRETVGQIGRDAGGAALFFTVVEGVYADPCHIDAGLIDPPVGPTADDLATALARLPGLTVSGPTDTMVGGVPAVAVTLTAPAVFEECTSEPQAPPYTLWGVPEFQELAPGGRDRLWVLEVQGTRLVIGAMEFPDSTPAALAELNEIVSSIVFDPVVAEVVNPSEAPAATKHPLPVSGPLQPVEYLFPIQLHRFAEGMWIPLDGQHAVQIFAEEPGWSSAGNGMQRPGADAPTVGIGAWSVGRIYADPCHWQGEDPAVVDPVEYRTMQGLADVMARWPGATEPIDAPRYGRFGQFVEITIPPDLDLAACDGGEYRLWEDVSGRPRVAHGAGERIELYVVDADPGVIAVDFWTLPSAEPEDREAVDRRRYGVWLWDPEPGSGE